MCRSAGQLGPESTIKFPWWIRVGASLLLLACQSGSTLDTGGDTSLAGDTDELPAGYTLLSSAEIELFEAMVAGVRYQREDDIPHELLTEEEINFGNDHLSILVDAAFEPVAYVRPVFSLVECPSGACQAIRFSLLYSVTAQFLLVYHPPGSTHDLKKYVHESGAHVLFDDTDWELLNAIVSAPASSLDAVTDMLELVADATSTAVTLPAYADDVVPGAAFTTWIVLVYARDTEALIEQLYPW